jgi:hypothetical protein
MAPSYWARLDGWAFIGPARHPFGPKGKPSELVYGTTICLPGAVYTSAVKGDHRKHVAQLPVELQNCTFVFARLIQCNYDSPFKVLGWSAKYFTLDLNGRQDTVSIDHLKPAFLDADFGLSEGTTAPSSNRSQGKPQPLTPVQRTSVQPILHPPLCGKKSTRAYTQTSSQAARYCGLSHWEEPCSYLTVILTFELVHTHLCVRVWCPLQTSHNFHYLDTIYYPIYRHSIFWPICLWSLTTKIYSWHDAFQLMHTRYSRFDALTVGSYRHNPDSMDAIDQSGCAWFSLVRI